MKTIITKGNLDPVIWGYGTVAKEKIHKLAKVGCKYNQQTTIRTPWKPMKGVVWNADEIAFKDMSGTNSKKIQNFFDDNGYLHLDNCGEIEPTEKKLIAFFTTEKENNQVVYNFEGVYLYMDGKPSTSFAERFEHRLKLISTELIEL